MKTESLTMGTVGVISIIHGTQHFLTTGRVDLMSVVFGVLFVLYFASLAYDKRTK